MQCFATKHQDSDLNPLVNDLAMYFQIRDDFINLADEEYMKFRATARNPAWQAQLMSQTIEERRALAAQLRSMSAESNSNKAEDIMDVTPAEVEREMAEAGVTQMIHGHTHRPATHDLMVNDRRAQRIVLGDWYTQGSVLRVQPGRYELSSL